MKFVKISILLIIAFFTVALTPDEATLYGSRIIVCIPSVTIKYWTTTQFDEKGRKGKENFVFDLMTKKSYPFKDCELYKCSPDPWRMNACKDAPVKGNAK